MEENPHRNVGRSTPASESDFVPAARELVQTPVVTRSGDVSRAGRAETTSTMVHRSHVRENRSSAVNPEIESRPETVSVPDVELSADVAIAAPTSVGRGFGTT